MFQSDVIIYVSIPAAAMGLAVAFTTPAQAEMGPNICQNRAESDPRFRTAPAGTIWDYKPAQVASGDVITPSNLKTYKVGTDVIEQKANGTMFQSQGIVRNQRDCYEYTISQADYERAQLKGQFNFSVDIIYDDKSVTRTCLPLPPMHRSADINPAGNIVVRFNVSEDERNRAARHKALDETDKNPKKSDQVWCYSVKLNGLPTIAELQK